MRTRCGVPAFIACLPGCRRAFRRACHLAFVPVGLLVGLLAFLLATPLPLSAQGSGNPSPAGRISVATSALNQLSGLDAAFLIPDSYKGLREAYDRYARVIRDGESSGEIQRAYSEFDAALVLARERLERVNEVLMIPLERRAAAREANAHAIVPDAYEAAESRLERAVSRLEDDRVSDAFQEGQEAARFYEDARKSVIEMSLIGPARNLVAEAEENGMDRFAPVSFQIARELIGEVAGALERGEPPTAALRNKAQNADYAARRATQLAARIDTLRGEPGNWEVVLRSRENLVEQVAHEAGLTTDFLVDDPQRILTASLDRLAARQDSIVTLLRRAEGEAAALGAAVDSLNQAISEQQIRLSSMVEEFQRDLQQRKEALDRERRELRVYLHEKVQLDAAAQAKERFSEGEVAVIRAPDRITLRLAGLAFQAGRTEIPAGSRGLLVKLGEFLLLYPQTRVDVEGHTDATGKEDKNIELSKARADAVAGYLSANGGVPDERMNPSGFGSARPIASNNTGRGRTQNRRIDVILIFERDR